MLEGYYARAELFVRLLACRVAPFAPHPLRIYAALYVIFITDYFFPINDPDSWDIDNSALKILFGLFVIGYVISWKSELASGVIFILWFIGMCYHNFFLCTSDCGAGIAMGIPLLILSIFFIVYGIKKKR